VIVPLRTRLGRGAALLAGLLAVLAFQLFSRPSADVWSPRVVVVPKGSNSAAAARILAAEGVLRRPLVFRALLLATRTGRKVHFGEYTFRTPPSTVDVWRKLVDGDVTRHDVTVPPGSNLYDVARLLAADNLATAEAFLEAARDRTVLAGLGIDAPSAEGFLFPETYRLVREQTPAEILGVMHREFRKRFTKEMEEDARRQGYTVAQLLTMASIIEKETSVPAEKPLVSAVIRRRIALGMPLQMDPTVIYGLKLFGKDISKRALRTESPYNTYTIRGLPPGPIANPGMESIEAALRPAESGYLYFVARADGTHEFSRTLEEHNRAVARYRALIRSSPGIPATP
jgi:UPF0755 protein